ncbi:MAG: TonB-dependent receptor plug domain-containing protein [Bacteroidales bacterium]
MMKKISILTLLVFFSLMLSAQEKSDSIAPIHWPDTLTAKQFNQGVIGDPLQLILGKEAGAEVFKAGSDPNVPSSFSIRGAGSTSGENYPLYVIDGIVGGDLFLLPPEEIESVKILKNLSETSFYGNEGNNGVIIVTTKSGKKNRRLSVDFNTAISLGQTSRLQGLFTAQEMRDKAAAHPEIQFTDGGANTDWQEEVFRTTVSQSYQLSVGGTLKNTSYRLSFDHIAQPGNVRGSDRNVNGGSVNLSQTAFKNKLRVNGLFSFYQTGTNTIPYTPGRSGQNPLYQVFIQNPTDPVYTSSGSYFQSNRAFQQFNPLALVTLTSNEATGKNLAAVLNATWEIWKGIGIKVTGSYQDKKGTSRVVQSIGTYSYPWTYESEGSSGYSRTDILAGVTFNRSLKGDHNVDLFAGYMYRSSRKEQEVSIYFSDTSENISMGKSHYQDYGILASLNYNYKHKYNLGVILNQEHDVSKVTPSQSTTELDWGEWVFYPGITASWEVHREGFMAKIKPLSTLILRGSYGIAGIRPKDSYINLYNAGFKSGKMETERTIEFTGGLDLGLFRNRILLAFDYYHRNSGNIILRENLPVPPNLVSYSYTNGMKVVNSGIELSMSGRVIDKPKLLWNSLLAFSRNKNKVVSIDGDVSLKSGYIDYYFHYTDSPYLLTTTSGSPCLAFNLPVSTGYYQGVPVYEKKGGGLTTYLSSAARTVVDKVYPDFYLSWTNSFTVFKAIDVSVMVRYVAGHRIFNGTRMYLSIPDNYLSLNTIAEAENNYNDGVLQIPFSDIYLENASYLRLENLCIGYTYMPQNSKWKGHLRVYVAVNNLFTITDYSGLDPSFNGNSPGMDYFNTYPKNHTYTIGLNLVI